MQQRKELFNEPDSANTSAEEVVTLDDNRDLWKAVPALADPDNVNSSYEEEEGRESGRESGVWDPDAAFSEVERVLESLEGDGHSIHHELVGRFRLLAAEEIDKRSDDSGMSSTSVGDASNASSGSSSTGSEPSSAAVPTGSAEVVKPVRKSKQVVSVAEPTAIVRNNNLLAGHHRRVMQVYTVTRDSPAVLALDDASDQGSHRRHDSQNLDLSTEGKTKDL